MHKVSANYTMPTILNTLKPAPSNGVAKAVNVKAGATSATSTGSTTTSSSSSSGGLDSTFLNLLAEELQNQDPTAPVDPTQMVGQMISLNQLQQLIDINQTLTQPAAGSSATGTQSSTSPTSAVQPNSGSASAAIL